MGHTTSIAWAESSWNPWVGCTPVSPGCANCYALQRLKRFGHDPRTLRRTTSVFDAPLFWQQPRRVFVGSMSDFFHADADGWRDDAWDVMRRADHHIYMILTKRPERVARALPHDWGPNGWPHVWLGVTVEKDGLEDRVWTLYHAGPMRLLFVSAEPLLGPVDLLKLLRRGIIGWVICGGESGPQHRHMDMRWARSLRDQCAVTGVPFFFKQQSDYHAGRRPWIVEPDGQMTCYQELPVIAGEEFEDERTGSI